jgi:hypothetical protein
MCKAPDHFGWVLLFLDASRQVPGARWQLPVASRQLPAVSSLQFAIFVFICYYVNILKNLLIPE